MIITTCTRCGAVRYVKDGAVTLRYPDPCPPPRPPTPPAPRLPRYLW